MLTILEVCPFNKRILVILKNALFSVKRSRLLSVSNWKKKKKKRKNYDYLFRKDLLNVSEKIHFKVFGLLIKVLLNNQKLHSNLVNPEYTQFNSALFIQSHKTNQNYISMWTLQKFVLNSMTSYKRFNFLKIQFGSTVQTDCLGCS